MEIALMKSYLYGEHDCWCDLQVPVPLLVVKGEDPSLFGRNSSHSY